MARRSVFRSSGRLNPSCSPSHSSKSKQVLVRYHSCNFGLASTYFIRSPDENYENERRGFPIVSVRLQSVSGAIRRKDGRGRPSTPFLRERILVSAAELFAEKEFDLVLIDEVAAHAGVGKGSVYRQFKSKEQLYAAVVINGFAELQREIRAALSGASTMPAPILTIVRHTMRFFWTRRQFFALMRDPKALPRSQSRHYRAQLTELSRMISGILDDSIKPDVLRPDLDTQITAESLIGTLSGCNRFTHAHTNAEPTNDIATPTLLHHSTF